jgi:hypothetical protein
MSGEELSLGIGNGFSIPWSRFRDPRSHTGGIASTTGTPAGGVK